MFQASVNDRDTVTIDFAPQGPTLNDAPFDWDLVRLSDRTFHILRNNQSYTAELIDMDAAAKSITLKINQALYQVQLKDRFDLLLEQMGMSNAAGAKVNDIKAPMPGLIVGVSVEPGTAVQKGDIVLILEAMKMENAIKAPGDATVRTIRVVKGDRVEKNQVLIEFE
ncbi:hypothetical protein GCM10023187_16880 [Nibrella viscosa]|uniref:Lipoyl-binding domain-containing protein n=1 Tax=Nibrella viscosa TaxID=1084524 RepID=A0ABP8K8A3_9BACT